MTLKLVDTKSRDVSQDDTDPTQLWPNFSMILWLRGNIVKMKDFASTAARQATMVCRIHLKTKTYWADHKHEIYDHAKKNPGKSDLGVGHTGMMTGRLMIARPKRSQSQIWSLA